LLPALCCVAVLIQAVHGVTVAVGEHNDSRTILDTVPAILSGHYQRSRSLGVPLYELMAAVFIGVGGTLLANLYSLALAIGSIFIFNHLLGRDISPARRGFALIAFALNPIFLTNSTMVIEWMQVVFLLLCLLVTAASILRTGRTAALGWYGLASIAAVLTRPDLCLFCAALFFALLWHTRDIRLGIKLAGVNALAAATTIVIFLSLNDLKDLSTAITVEDRELVRRVGLAIVDVVALLGVVGTVIAIVILSMLVREGWKRRAQPLPFELKMLLLILPIVAVRLVMLPSKVEFLFPLLIVFLLAAARHSRSMPMLGLLSLSLVLGSVLQISFLDRDPGADALHLRIGLHPGAVAQDYDRRIQNALLFNPFYLAAVAEAVYGDQSRPHPTLQPRIFFPGLIGDNGDLVIGAPATYMLDDPRFAFGPGRLMFGGNGDSRRSAYQHIYICNKSVAAAGKGWRVLQAPTPIAQLDPTTHQVDTTCAREGAT
jgi:hypothetical protein